MVSVANRTRGMTDTVAPELPIYNDQGSPDPHDWGIGKMDYSTNREVICTKCQVQIDGRAIALSATEYICSNCWPFFFRPVLEEKVAASERRREEANDDI